MDYIHVAWMHDYVEEPVELWSELDEGGNEVRRIQLFRDGRIEWVDESGGTDEGGLGEVPIDLDEIRQQADQFLLKVIDRPSFEQRWDSAAGRRQGDDPGNGRRL